MSDFTIALPKKVPEWGTFLVSEMTKCFEKMNEHMNQFERNMNDKLDAFKLSLENDIKAVNDVAMEARDIARANAASVEHLQSDVEKLKSEMFSMTRTYNGLLCKNQQLQQSHDKQESYSRRENLLIRGIKEQAEETEKMCEDAVRQLLISEMNINDDKVKKMVLVRCHRIGPNNNDNNSTNYCRAIIVRFLDFNDRKLVWGERMALAGKEYSISENFANNIEYRRRLLYPIMKAAKKSAKYQKVLLRGDILVVDNEEYSFDNLQDLPQDLHPKQFSFKTNKDWLIFGGPHSTFNFLPNYFPKQLTYKDIIHDTAEHAYQFAKAQMYNDSAAEEKILCADNPGEAKRIGGNVKNFNRKDWDNRKKKIMLDILRIKFKADSDEAKLLKDTDGKSLAEAGKSKVFAVGLTLNNRNILDTSKWSKDGNLLGKCLMEIRNELLHQ